MPSFSSHRVFSHFALQHYDISFNSPITKQIPLHVTCSSVHQWRILRQWRKFIPLSLQKSKEKHNKVNRKNRKQWTLGKSEYLHCHMGKGVSKSDRTQEACTDLRLAEHLATGKNNCESCLEEGISVMTPRIPTDVIK